MSTSLTTFDGYPRDDLDIAQSTSLPLFSSLHTPPLPTIYGEEG